MYSTRYGQEGIGSKMKTQETKKDRKKRLSERYNEVTQPIYCHE